MIIEILSNNDGYIYLQKDDNTNIRHYKDKIVSHEIIDSINIYAVKDLCNTINLSDSDNSMLEFKCKHGINIQYSSLNLLPSENWHELIDCWSCHDNEFANVKNLRIKVRPNGILLSSFFILINSCDLPICCQVQEPTHVKKIWLNNLQGVNHKKLIFFYLATYFNSNSVYIFQYEGKIYEIKLFYTCKCLIYEDKKYYNVMKIGIKEKHNIYFDDTKMKETINEYYIKLIYESILHINIKILDYQTGFIYY